jgi:HAD superfamily hydrolase (TIGR01549 family)
VDAVVFDLDDTLIVEEAAARRAISAALSVAGVEASAEDVDLVLACARRHWRASRFYEQCRRLGIASWEGLWAGFEGCHRSLDGLAGWAPAYRQAAWSDALEALGADPSLSARVGDRYTELQRRGHPSIPGAIEAVRRASKRARTGLLTNGPPDIQRLKLSQTGLGPVLDSVVVSAEEGVGKPDPAAFRLVLERLGVGAADAVMIGDSWERDIRGALEAGMAAVWIGRGRIPPEDRRDVMIIDELNPEVLEDL